jgi:hypothetical protein
MSHCQVGLLAGVPTLLDLDYQQYLTPAAGQLDLLWRSYLGGGGLLPRSVLALRSVGEVFDQSLFASGRWERS